MAGQFGPALDGWLTAMSDAFSGGAPRWLPWSVVVAATLLLVGSAAYVSSSLGQSLLGPGMAEVVPTVVFPSEPGVAPSDAPVRSVRPVPSGGNPTMRTHVWVAGDGVPVTTIAAARHRATAAAAASSLHVGRIIQFSTGFYAVLRDAAGLPAAEVLVDPVSGTVLTEYGPAATWTSGPTPYVVSTERATAIANAWLQTYARGQSVDSVVLFPGHYTMSTTAAGGGLGLLSVNATTGAVWYHSWNGAFIAQEDA